MHKKLLFIAFLFSGIYSMAQPCDPRELAVRPGKWKGPGGGSTSEIPAATVQKEKALMAQLHNRFKEFYNPVGLVVSYSYVVGFSRNRSYVLEGSKNWPALPYYYSCRFLKYACHPVSGKELVNGEGETNTMIVIYVNDMRPIVPIEPHELDPESDDSRGGWVVLGSVPEKIDDGFYRFNLEVINGRAYSPKETHEAWLITYDGKLPYKPVTRKEYLEKLREKFQKDIIKHPDLSDTYKKYLDRISKYLSDNNAETLSRQTYVDRFELYMEFNGFAPDGEGSYIIKPNLDYYNRKLSQSAPQFFVVETRSFSLDYEVYRNAITDARKAVDIDMLKVMLGKEVGKTSVPR